MSRRVLTSRVQPRAVPERLVPQQGPLHRQPPHWQVLQPRRLPLGIRLCYGDSGSWSFARIYLWYPSFGFSCTIVLPRLTSDDDIPCPLLADNHIPCHDFYSGYRYGCEYGMGDCYPCTSIVPSVANTRNTPAVHCNELGERPICVLNIKQTVFTNVSH